MHGFRGPTARIAEENVKQELGMSEAESAYRHGLAEDFGSPNLTCYFHVTQAAKDYLAKHMQASSDIKDETCESVSVTSM